MTAVILDPIANLVPTELFYACFNGEPLAESYDHLYVITISKTTSLNIKVYRHLNGLQHF
jgi:hypothetical protein